TREYHRRIQLCDPVSTVVNDQVTTLNYLYCHQDPLQAAETGMRMVNQFGVTNSHLLWTREAYPTRAYQSLGNLAPGRAADRSGPGDPHGIPEGIGIGTPDRLASVIQRWESLGVSGINFLLNAGEVISQHDVLASLRLFATEVMPKFRGEAVLAPQSC
ncbi:MAG: hypothetical protein J2P57_24935, partial [Acidimicrobiaceae bacterium]|nr:hypothetical protein [Acidimicrobiaceae bacterium]